MIAGSGLAGAFVCGVDIGGSGCRARLAEIDASGRLRPVGPDLSCVSRVGRSHRTDDILALVAEVARGLDCGVREGPSRLRSVCLDSAGMSSLVSDGARLAESVAGIIGADVVLLVPDSVAAHRGALAGGSGVVVAVGTGTIALGTDHRSVWRRRDGWGLLLGDCGSGAWIGRQGLRAALDAYERRGSSGSPALLDAAMGLFGDPPSWPMKIASRADAVRIIASFAPAVARCADSSAGDAVAEGILREAGGQIADTAIAAWCEALPMRFSYTGGILENIGRVRESFLGFVRRRMPSAVIHAPAGDALDGAVSLAALAAGGDSRVPPASSGCIVYERDGHDTDGR